MNSLTMPEGLSHRETVTILAALRFWQEHTNNGGRIPAHFDHFEEVTPLTVPEIDTLCESINLQPVPDVHPDTDEHRSGCAACQLKHDKNLPDEDTPQAVEDQEKWIAAAKRIHQSDGQVEIDDGAVVSISDDGGAYVAAWVWVDDAEVKA